MKVAAVEQLKEDPMATPFMLNMKVNSLQEIERNLNSFTLQSAVVRLYQNEDIDLGPLSEILIPFADTQEVDELWEFRNLKNEISVIVSFPH